VTATRALLASFGAADEPLAEVEAYLANPYSGLGAESVPLAPEPQVDFWRRYAEEARREGAAAALARRFPQLLFPVAAGIARDDAYRAATRRGEFDPERPAGGGLGLARPDALDLSVDDGPAGPVPVLVARHRPDFVRLVQALTCRNEPEPVPESMGACLVKGLADWERVRAYRAAWEASLGRASAEEEWAAEMAGGLAPQKELWQDRLIVLSDGPYSAVPAEAVVVDGAALDGAAWRERSIAIRLAHESFHYLTLRLSGAMRSHFLDELLADYAGLVAAFGRYDRALALRCLGLERLPEIRPDGRLVNYRGALSDGALALLARLLAAASAALGGLPPFGPEHGPAARARRLVTLAALGLDGLAAPGLAERIAERER
jgi:hypothetical protein